MSLFSSSRQQRETDTSSTEENLPPDDAAADQDTVGDGPAAREEGASDGGPADSGSPADGGCKPNRGRLARFRASQVDGAVEKPGAYLARTVTNLSLSRLTSATAQRERYVGPWLPEPLIGDSSPDVANDVADAAEQAESVSLAMLVVLESLSPAERAVFILREVFGYPHREIADALGRTEAAVRQLARRAKSQVADRRPRFPTSAAEQRRVTEEFLTACMGGDIGRMMELLAPDVMVWTDGGGQVSGAASRPVQGSEHAAHGALRAFQGLTDMTTSFTLVNGRPGVVITEGGVVDRVACMEVVNGLITEVRVICNPEKLRHVRVH